MTTYQMLLVLIQSKFAYLWSFPRGPRYSRVKLVKALDTFFMHACPYKLARFNFPSKHLTSNFQAGDDLFARAKRGDPEAKKILKEQMLEILFQNSTILLQTFRFLRPMRQAMAH